MTGDTPQTLAVLDILTREASRPVIMMAVSDIIVPDRHRAIIAKAVDTIEKSILDNGLRSPIDVRPIEDGQYEIVVGARRFAACKQVGLTSVPVRVIDGSDEANEMWRIAENLHRDKLTPLQKDERVALYVELQEARNRRLSQIGTGLGEDAVSRSLSIREAAAELGWSKSKVHRALAVARLSDAAKDLAKKTGLENVESVLVDAAKARTPSAQVESLRAAAEARVGKAVDASAKKTSNVDPSSMEPRVKPGIDRAGALAADLPRASASDEELHRAKLLIAYLMSSSTPEQRQVASELIALVSMTNLTFDQLEPIFRPISSPKFESVRWAFDSFLARNGGITIIETRPS